MWVLRVRDRFSSAHYLRHYEGKCERLHGHNWMVEVEVEGDSLDKETGILVDFKILKGLLDKVLHNLDHRLLNEIEPFTELNPSSEILAKYIYEKLKRELLDYPNVRLRSVTVWESDSASATYYE